ncbi:MAG: response regulator [Myxococcales bacterium]|nr:MAG: response regulator [Myxococcales bacterium]
MNAPSPPSSSRRSAVKARTFGVVAAGVAGAIGCVWLSLWLYGSPEARAFVSSRSKTNTSVSLILLALGYGLLSLSPTPARRRVAAVAISTAGLIGVGTSFEYLSGADLGIDQLLARDAWSAESARYPNRMSPTAALCFVLLAACPWLITRKHTLSAALGQTCAVLTLGVCSIGLVGYLYSASILYQPLPYIRLSPYTAVANLLLVASAFALRPDVGLGRVITSTSIGGYLARRLLPITLLLPVIVGWLLLDADHHSVLAPSESHALLATAVALVMAPTVLFLALSLDRLERDRMESEDFLRNTAELTSALARARSVGDVVEATMDLGLPALKARAGWFLRVSEDGKRLDALASRGYPEEVALAYGSFALDSNLPAALAVTKREPVFLGSAEERDQAFPSLTTYNAHGSWAALPLEGSRGVLGSIALSFAEGQRFDKTTRSRARQLAWQCAQALDRALLFDSEQIARQRAEAASRAKDEFLAMLGHELRNPLSPILTSLHLMELRDASRSVKEREVIKRQVSHMVRLVDDLLDVSRIASGRVELKREVVELATVASAAIELATPLFEQRQHRLMVEVPEQGLAVDVDRGRMVQVLSNLLTNSAKYTSVGGRVELRAERRDGQVQVRVSDNGVGIAPELLGSVFDLFVQGARTLDRSEGGLGLGLSLVKSLVELHGGKVFAKSDGPGHGSEFSVTLPLAPTEQMQETARAPRVTPLPNRRQRILLVDDNRDAADSTAQVLREVGHEVRVAYDGPSALDLSKEQAPSLALLDIGLPVMDGYELARRLREQQPSAALKLIALTGYGQKADRERSLQAGFDAHLVKPVGIDELLTLVSKLGPAQDAAS